ncbi:hypothetical protein PF011_g1868 [Phytophthora fragariae]|uniref:Uncharacterized protein n=1 Tax=Phytophthora fragariae TaxID=53985 RepID=A0A6A3MHT8_9STRA|nr:hypothetical protein PF011_g1868 [Phytophthora fragariae]
MDEDKLAQSITSRQMNDARYKLFSYVIHGIFEHAQDWHFALTSFQLFNATCGQYVYFGGISLLREVVKQKYGS